MATILIGVIALILFVWLFWSFVLVFVPAPVWYRKVADRCEEWACNAIGVAGLCLAVFGIVVIGYQGLLWLRQGYWTSLEVRLAWEWLGRGDPYFPRWQGMQKIVIGILDQSLALALFVAGVVISWTGFAMAADAVRVARRAQLWRDNLDEKSGGNQRSGGR